MAEYRAIAQYLDHDTPPGCGCIVPTRGNRGTYMERIDNQPRPEKERGLALWVGLALGFAGVIVTAGGIYEWTNRKAAHRPAVITTPTPAPPSAAAPVVDPEVMELRRQLAEEQRARMQAEARAFQREQEAAAQRPRRCIDGVRFEQFGREWRNVGRC